MRKPSDKLYVIGNPGRGTVKIGIAADVARRLAELSNSACPWGVDSSALVALKVYRTPRARGLEAFLHSSFAAVRLRRAGFVRSSRHPSEGLTEWFRFGAGALYLIDGRVAQFGQEVSV